ncbi:hypothetical protein BS47DRAFT_774673 [Hydnum rufescens UP504]|uniref:Uncharacterized protein n=1 Tax=Hydnum rufescens UP504 TaxID=1448309 RepID=A0A9P6B0X4_9AGAM|nr:hypothetical protein BS47DRAFT_774673 [Hydnum rufescens UP504]
MRPLFLIITPPLIDPRMSGSGHPPVIKITLYRLLNTMIILGVGTAKFILAMQGHSISPTILDWVLGSLYVVVTYWIGFLEDVRPPVWPWLFSEVRMMPLVRKLFSMVMGAIAPQMGRHEEELETRTFRNPPP